MRERTEGNGSLLNKLIQRAMGEKKFGTPTKEENQSRTRSVGTSVGQTAADQSTRDQASGYASHQKSAGYGSDHTSDHTVDQKSIGQASSQTSDQKTTSQASSQTSDQKTTSQTSAQKTSGRKGSSTFLKGLISGTVISDSLILKDIRYSALILILGIIFIANRFNAERVEREITVLEQEVRDMRAEALSVSADLGSVSRQSEITDLVKERGLGLEELREPPYRIVVNE